MPYYVYILANATNAVLYTGMTNNLPRRVYQHKSHVDPGSFTARYHVDRLVYYETHGSIEAAIAREKQIKSWKRARKEALVVSINPAWIDLYGAVLE